MPVLIQSKSLSNRFLLSCFMGSSVGVANYSAASTHVTGIGRNFSSVANYICIFPGTQPTNAQLIGNWVSTIRSTILAQFDVTDDLTMFNAYSQSTVLPPNIGFINDNTALSVNASATGTASWALYIATPNSTPATVDITTAPYMILPVSLNTETGIVRMPSVNLTAGNPCQITFHLYTAGGV